MALVMAAIAAEMTMVTGLVFLRLRVRGSAQRQAERFRAAAEEARRLAYNARIVDASMAELSELVVEQCLAEAGMGAPWAH